MDDEPGTTLTVDELLLRPWRPTDAPAVLAACQDPEIARWVTIPQPYLPADADAFIENAMTMWRDGTGAPFAIVDARTERLLGAVTRFGPDGHQATLGCGSRPRRAVAASARGRSRCRGMDVRDDRVHRIDCFIMVGNEASERMVERAGFQREGVLRAWDLHHDGVSVDCVVYSLLRSDE